jgi:hypothetical protein
MAGGCSVKVAGSVCVFMALAAGTPVYASNLTITPTFDSSITSDPNAAAIEGIINSAISSYEADFSNPIDVTIDLQEMTSGLGQSSTTLYTLPYSTFFSAYQTNAVSNNNVTALAALGTSVQSGPDNPVNGDPSLDIKTADIRALGIGCSCPPIGGFDGVIGLNTSITFPPNEKNGSSYSLLATTEHEMDEVLGLGSTLGSSLTEPQPEDLFRYDSLGHRTFTTSSGALAFFSVTGQTDLAQFDNQNDGGDFGDWQSNPRPGGVQPKVQDAFATPGATPQLGVELIALQAVGYDEISSVPEPSSVYFFIVALPVFGLFARRHARIRRDR